MNPTPDTDTVIADTRNWLEKLVIGLNLCPFAQAPFKNERIAYTVTLEEREEALYQQLLLAMDQLCNDSAKVTETTLLIMPNALADFEAFLDFAEMAEQTLERAKVEEFLQLANFHPHYCFDGEPEDDPANFSNRSPYPMLHLIRADEMEKALNSFPNPETIPDTNIARLREMGSENIQKLLQDAGLNIPSPGSSSQ